MKKWIRLIMPLLTALLAACQADYKHEAMLRAREYTLEQARLLPETARAHIRYTTPELQFIKIFEHVPMRLTEYDHIARNIDFNPEKDPRMDTILSQFVWSPPDLGYSVIAIGRSRRNMDFWEPLKVILKNIAPYQEFYEYARRSAVKYVTYNMLYLSALERLRVRTTEAEVRETSFDLDYLFDEPLQSSKAEWKEFLKELKDQQERRQYSFIWRTDDGKRRIVISGFGSVADLENWKAACGMVIPAAKLDEFTIEIIRKSPDDKTHAEDDGPVQPGAVPAKSPAEPAPVGNAAPAKAASPAPKSPAEPARAENAAPAKAPSPAPKSPAVTTGSPEGSKP